MRNELDHLFLTKKTKIMAHVVAGYPDLETSRQLAVCYAAAGADLIEIQIPFTDPLADGPAITSACGHALRSSVQPGDVLRLAASLRNEVAAPLLLMTYGNIPMRAGWRRFIAGAAASGISGLIVPDLPFDEPEGDYLGMARKSGLHPIMVVSPGMRPGRLKHVLGIASGFVYATLRVGITGAEKNVGKDGLQFLARLREATRLPVAAGFGVSSPGHAALLRGKADVLVIGSHLLDLYHDGGAAAAAAFLQRMRRTLDQ